MRKLKKEQRVDYATARARALAHLARGSRFALFAPSAVACSIWPGHGMRGQGAGLAAVAILTKMKAEGLCAWDCREHGRYRSWGWYITTAGRKAAQQL